MGKRRQDDSTGDSLVQRIASVRLPPALRRAVRTNRLTKSPVAYEVNKLGGQKKVFAILRECEDEEAQRVVQVWDQFQITRVATGWSLEDVLREAELSPKAFMRLVYGEFFERNVLLGKAIHLAAYPQIMQASTRRAQEPDATAERRMHFEATGFLPTRAGMQIAIQNVNQVKRDDDESTPGRPAAFERTARRIVRDLPPAK